MRSLVIIFSLVLVMICTGKPVYGPIGVAEKHKLSTMIEKEEKSLELLKEEERLLERVVETLSQEIEQKEVKIQQIKSISTGDTMQNLLEDYRRNYGVNSAQFRPG